MAQHPPEAKGRTKPRHYPPPNLGVALACVCCLLPLGHSEELGTRLGLAASLFVALQAIQFVIFGYQPNSSQLCVDGVGWDVRCASTFFGPAQFATLVHGSRPRMPRSSGWACRQVGASFTFSATPTPRQHLRTLPLHFTYVTNMPCTHP